MRRTLVPLTVGALIATLPACGGRNPPPTMPMPASAAADTALLRTPLAIRPGDVIKIVVWGHDDLSGEFPIDENYDLLFPLIGMINVRELSVAQLRERLNRELSQLFQQPFVAITPMFRVAVLGEVFRPGLYSVDATLTVFDLLALAGGPLRSANERRMQLVRGGQEIRVSLDPSAISRATLRELGIRSGDQLVVPRRSVTREDWGIIFQVVNLVLLTYSILR